MITLEPDKHLHIGALLFPRMDQMDLTGPFEVLARIPHSTFHLTWKDVAPVRDARGLLLTPDVALEDVPPLDVLLVPGGSGQMELMEDAEVLDFLREQAAHAALVFSVCTGALTLGAAGLLRGIKCTTHWASFHVLEHLGAVPVNQRVVVDGKFVSTAGISAGIDGALRVAEMLCGERVAQEIQLYMQYAPDPPFQSGSPDTAPPEVLASARADAQKLADARVELAQRIAGRWE